MSNNLHLLNNEQRQALAQWAKDFREAMPRIAALTKAAQDTHDAMINAPGWYVQDAPKPDDQPEPQEWSTGPPKVNFVDHIEVTEPEGTQ